MKRSDFDHSSKSVLEGCVLPNKLLKLNRRRHGLSQGKILMLVVGLVSHQVEVKND